MTTKFNYFFFAFFSKPKGNLAANEVPQFVLLGFSGAVNELVFESYKKVLGYQGKFNPTQNR